LEAGDLVAADARLISASSLQCLESALTGESEAVRKTPHTLEAADAPLGDRSNMVFMGTSVAAGTGKAVVVATGMRTELGGIAGMLGEADVGAGTPLQRKLDAFGRVLLAAALGLVAVLFVLGVVRGTGLMEVFMTSVSLTVAAIPEGLPAVVTVALALGVVRMSRRRALVRRLPAVETLGETSVVCTDKTGTLTVGEMSVRSLYVAGRRYDVTGEGYEPEGGVHDGGAPVAPGSSGPLLDLATVLVACNNAHLIREEDDWKVVGDPTEGALMVAGRKAGADRERIDREEAKFHELPFDSDRKRRTVIRRRPGTGLRAYVNGAPDVLLARCSHLLAADRIRPMTDDDRREVMAANSAMAAESLRVLGSAWRDLEPLESPEGLTAEWVERDLVFVGLSGMHDPPRAEAAEAVARCHRAGIRVVMITGDHPHTATAVARDLGIATDAAATLTGVELERLGEDELRHRVDAIHVYARVTAAHKLDIVRAWKATGAVVAMTGDGVNDAPAIKAADVGIAMGRTGTEVTKQAADIIMTDDNFATIVAAIEEGRGIYDNIRKSLQYLLAGNTGELLLVGVCVVAGLPAPLLPVHLLWINLVTDGLPALCLATDPIDGDVMNRGPRPREDRIISGSFLGAMALTGTLTALVSLGVFLFSLHHESVEAARTHAFATLVFAELFRSFGARSDTRPVWRMNARANLKLVGVVAGSFGLQILVHQSEFLSNVLHGTTVGLRDLLLLAGVSAIPLVVLELAKLGRRRGHSAPAAAS
jgi:Ca2+-transporting ATPase